MSNKWYELRLAVIPADDRCSTVYIAISDAGRLCASPSKHTKKFASPNAAIEFLNGTMIGELYRFEAVPCIASA